MERVVNFPSQQKPFTQKGVKWRKECVSWAAQKTYFLSSPIRSSVRAMKINQDLVNGVIHIDDIRKVINPTETVSDYIPDNIPHYPIINSTLGELQGEEGQRDFNFRVVVTNPNAISAIEEEKKQQLSQHLQETIIKTSLSEEEVNQKLEQLMRHDVYEYQDEREKRANRLLNHYIKELDVYKVFNRGIMDAMKFGEEIYRVSIVGGEPYLEKLNPMKVRIYRSGYSSKIEDADIIVIEDYLSVGKIIDKYYDNLTTKDIKFLEEKATRLVNSTDSMGNIDDRAFYINRDMITDVFEGDMYSDIFHGGVNDTLMPYDTYGNIRVVTVYWKSRRCVKKVKSYNEQGDIEYNFYPENYKLKKELGETEQKLWINEAWEGTLIGDEIFVNMRPCPIQFNRMSNPSRCHFGIIGSIYNKNDDKPFSLVDMMKPYSYFYDVVHDRLNKLIAKNIGKIIQLDLTSVPKGWNIDKWLYYIKMNNLFVKDSSKEISQGAARGVVAGALAQSGTGVIDAELGNSIQLYIDLLSFIKSEMRDIAGMSPQRLGAIHNRETVGGVERATMQSSFITEWLFTEHDNLKKRVLDAIVETAKVALKGRNKKFRYILDNGEIEMVNIDGDQFAENDYGLVVDNSYDTQRLSANMDALTQAALQNQYNLSTIMKLYSSASIMEKVRMLEREDMDKREMAEQQQQQQMQLQQQQMQQQQEQAQAQQELQYRMHQEDNDTKIRIAEINSKAEEARLALMNKDYNNDGIIDITEGEKEKLREQARQFDAKIELEKQKLAIEKQKSKNNK